MMKRVLGALLVVASSLGVDAQVVDAFQGILPVTDPQMRRSLNGEWSLKVVDGITDDKSVPVVDKSWGRIPVPGCWETYGFCKPSYDKALPLTGYYRTTFTVPAAWKGQRIAIRFDGVLGQRIAIRFDGVLYGYDLWINGKAAGSWRSGYNTAIFDITDYLKGKGEQQLALRVISQFRGSDFDYNDDWAPNGIFRDVTLMAIPETHLSDLTIRTKNSGEVVVDTKVERETPYLYTLRTTLSRKGKVLQTFDHTFGFRELTIDGKILNVALSS